MNLDNELDVALSLAREAGRAILTFYGTTESETKAGGSPVTAADHAANRIIVEGLARDFKADQAQIEKDVRLFLTGLAEKGLLDFHHDPPV